MSLNRAILSMVMVVCMFSITYSNHTFGADTLKFPTDSLEDRIVTISNIFILGNKKTKESIILRELNFDLNQRIGLFELQEIIERDEQKIFNLRLFNTVKITVLETTPTTVDILIQVTERWYLFPIPLFKLADRNFNDWWVNRGRDLSRVNYGLKLYSYNMRGRNERLRLIAQFGFTRDFQLNYRVPYISKRQQEGLIFNFIFRERKNTTYNTVDHLPLFIESEDIVTNRLKLETTYSNRASFYSYHYVTLGYNRAHYADTVLQLNPNILAGRQNNNRYFALTYRFVRDLRDFVNYPLKGFYLEASTTKEGLSFFDDVDIWRASLQYSHYADLGKEWYASVTASGTISLPLNQPYGLNQALGFGKNIIRGYELDVIEGPRFFLNKTNLKKRIFNRTYSMPNSPIDQISTIPLAIYAKLFFDCGWVDNYPGYDEQNINKRLSNTFLYGFGAGIDIVTFYDFVIRPEYSINSDGETNFFLNFKVDF